MSNFQEYLVQLHLRTGKDVRDAIIADISELGEEVIPQIIESFRNFEQTYALGQARVQIGRASTLPLLELFFEDFGEIRAIDLEVDHSLKALGGRCQVMG